LYASHILIPALSIQNPVFPEAGAIVHVRQRLYLAEQVVPPPSVGEATLVRLSCVDDDAQGQPLDVLWENELDAEVRTGENWQQMAERGFDPAQRFAAYPTGNGFLFALGTRSQGGRNATSQRRFNLGPQKCNITHGRIRLIFALR
jgi:hypothetical protein